MGFPRSILVAIFFFSLSCSTHAATEAEKLMAVDRFALGGVGVAGTPSAEEQIFRSILAQPDALLIFKKIVRKGRPAAQLYALCGLRSLDSKELETLATPVTRKGGDVETIRGCMISREPVDGVVRQICDGTLDPLLKNPHR